MVTPPTGPALTTGSGRVKEARKLSRRSVRSERRLFLAEGWKAIEAAAGVPGCLVEVFATASGAATYAGVLADLTAPIHPVDDRALASLCEAVTPQGLVAVCRFVDRPLDHVLDGAHLAVIASDVRDPGNAGTLLRTADAAGLDAAVLAGTSVDAYNPKTVRATVGSLFHVPLAIEPDAATALSASRAAGHLVLAADGDGEVDLYDAAPLLTGKVSWLFGNEAWGLPEELAALADHRIRIPIHGRAESLNLATAAAICLFESARVRAERG